MKKSEAIINFEFKSSDQELLDRTLSSFLMTINKYCKANILLMPVVKDTYIVMRGKEREEITISTHHRRVVTSEHLCKGSHSSKKVDFLFLVFNFQPPQGIDVILRLIN